MMNSAIRLAVVGVLALGAATESASADSFSLGNLVVYRVGSGTGDLVNTGSAVFLDEYTPTGTLVRSVAMPTVVSGSNKQLIASGTATSEGLLTLSGNGQYVMLTGYARDLGGTGSLSGTASSSVNRTVGRVRVSDLTIDTTTALTDYASKNNPRSVFSDDGTNLWVTGGAGGVRYTTLGSTTSTQLSTTLTNLRQVNAFDGQLYISTASGSSIRVGTVGTGLPTTAGQTISNLPNFPTSGSPYGFVLLDLSSSVPGMDTLYVADDNGNNVQKYAKVGSDWVAKSASPTMTGVRGLTVAYTNGTTTTLYATTGDSDANGGGTLWKLVDATGYNVDMSGTVTTIATASANTAFRGVVFIPEPAALSLLALGALALRRRRN